MAPRGRSAWPTLAAVTALSGCGGGAAGLRDDRPVLNEVTPLSAVRGASGFLPLDWREAPAPDETWREACRAGGFRAFPPGMPNLGRTSAAVWLRARIFNDTGENAERVLVLGWPRLTQVRAWAVSGPPEATKAEPLGVSGWDVPWSARPLPDPGHAFPVVLPAGAETTLLLRVSSTSEMLFPAQLLTWTELLTRERIGALVVGLYAGMVLALAGYNILVFLRVRQRYHLLYAASALCFLPWWLLNSGWALGLPGLAGHLDAVTTLLVVAWHFFRLAFARDFLRLEQISPRLNRALRVVQWWILPAGVAALYLVLPANVREYAWTFMEVPLVGATVVAGVVAYRAGLQISRWFLPATALLLAGLVLGHVIFAGVLLNPLFAGFSIMLGMLLELVVLTLALAERARETAARNEQVLRHATAHRLSSLEALVAGVTHELNTPLGALRSTSDSFVRAARRIGEGWFDLPETKRKKVLDAIPSLARSSRDATDRIEAVVTSLETFARLDGASVERVDISEGLRSALVLLQPRIPAGVDVDVDVPELPPICCRPAELNQAFMALLTNALEALSGATGRLEVWARAEGDAIEVGFRDTGCGIPSSEQANLFEPHIVKRGQRVKIGLGLSMVKSIVDAHDGAIEIESAEGEGTQVILRIPRDGSPAADDEPRAQPSRPSRR